LLFKKFILGLKTDLWSVTTTNTTVTAETIKLGRLFGKNLIGVV